MKIENLFPHQQDRTRSDGTDAGSMLPLLEGGSAWFCGGKSGIASQGLVRGAQMQSLALCRTPHGLANVAYGNVSPVSTMTQWTVRLKKDASSSVLRGCLVLTKSPSLSTVLERPKARRR